MLQTVWTSFLVLLGCGVVMACAGDPPPEQKPVAANPNARYHDAANRFDSGRAWADLKYQVELGPRVPGTASHEACGDWLVATLQAAGARITEDRFEHTDAEGTLWPLRNILARFGPEGGRRILLVAHWDTRPWADRDRAELHDQPILGANDGASGVAVLLEIARHLGQTPPATGVDLLFTDGEDLGRPGSAEGFCIGTKRFVAKGHAAQVEAVLVLDMIGDADLRIPVEPYSRDHAPELVDWVWGRAELLGVAAFVRESGNPVYDDHIPFLEAGIPAVDLIDFEFPAWHTHADNLSAVSEASLGHVGRVVLSLILAP